MSERINGGEEMILFTSPPKITNDDGEEQQ